MHYHIFSSLKIVFFFSFYNFENVLLLYNVNYAHGHDINGFFYWQDTKLRFLDTMSLHIATVGFTAFQRTLYQASKKETSPSKVREHLESKKYRNEEIVSQYFKLYV